MRFTFNPQNRKLAIAICLLFSSFLPSGCAQFQVPRFDPTGSRIFSPNNPTTVSPLPTTSFPDSAAPQFQPFASPGGAAPIFSAPAVGPRPRFAPVNAAPAFTQPPVPPPCNPGCGGRLVHRGKRPPLLLPHQQQGLNKGKEGTMIMTPSRIIAPVGSEVVVMAGLCGDDGHFVINQPLEWMLSTNSAGQFIEVGGMDHSTFNKLIKPSANKIDGNYAWGRTSLKPRLITRGNNTPTDDMLVRKGQAWVSLSSASPGSSYVTCVAPKTKPWDKRSGSTVIHWVDATWAIPAPMFAKAGQTAPLNVAVSRTTDGSGLQDWKVRYQVVGGADAEFLPDGAKQAIVTTDDEGQAPVQIRQPEGKVSAGTTNIRVDIIRPALFGERELVVESGMTSITWSAPALTIRAIGPREAAVDQPFAYRLEITNPGDQIAKDVVVRTKDFSDDIQYISSNPKPSQYGNQYEWKLGDIAPGTAPRTIDVQFKSDKRGTANLCFDLSSQTDQLQTEACAQTRIAGPCIGLKLTGPTTARVGDQIAFNIELVNECDYTLEDVQVEVTHDTGLNAGLTQNPFRTTLPNPLVFQQKQTLPVTFVMVSPGIRCFDVVITSKDGSTARGRKCIEVTQTNQDGVDVKVESVGVTQAGRKFQARTTVKNTGSTMLSNVNVVNRYSQSLELKQVSRGVTSQFQGDDFVVQLGNLSPGEEKSYVMEFEATAVDGNGFLQSSVLSNENITDSQRANIRIEPLGQGDSIRIPDNGGNTGGQGAGGQGQGGNTGLNVKVRSLDSPVRKNNEAKFQVTVTNNRSVTDQDVRITLLVPPGLRFKRLQNSALRVAGNSPDLTEIYLEPRREMRAFESITFDAVVEALEVGRPTMEVRAASRQTNQASGSDALDILAN